MKLNSEHILRILHYTSKRLKLDLDSAVLEETDNLLRTYDIEDLAEFIRDLTEMAANTGIAYIKKEIERSDFELFVENFDAPMILFLVIDDEMVPALIDTNSREKKKIFLLFEKGDEVMDFNEISQDAILKNASNQIIFLSAFAYESMVGSESASGTANKKLSPVTRLFHLLATDKKDIFYVYVYALIIGIMSLVLPLSIQAAVELISGGVFFSSIYFLIGVIIIGVAGSGVLQVLQITIVENLQRRVFTKAAFEFAYRVPRIKMEAVMNVHFPELMNRFFDVLTIQKGLPKLLIDLSTGVIQILFGLLLLSFYHPFFVFFGMALILILFLIFYFTGPKGMESSIIESKYKYKAVYWLEELARTVYSFKLSGTTDLPLRRTDYFVNNYLKNRRHHFRILVTQYSYILLFKAVITAGLLIIGTILVVQREITLGQFVASEVIIILILVSVEKIIMYTDVVYDMLTAVDKIAHVTDLPLEKTGGVDITKDLDQGLKIVVNNLTFTYQGSKKPSIKNVNLTIEKGEHVCISGTGDSGKTSLINVMAGMYTHFEGSVTYNKYSLRDLDRVHLRDMIGKNVSFEDIFEGTVLDNILVGKPDLQQEDAIRAIEMVGLHHKINSLPDGLQTGIMSAGKGFSKTFVQRLILARCIAKNPNVLILNSFFETFSKNERMELMQMLTDKKHKWTLLIVSNDPLIIAGCDRGIYLKKGGVLATGPVEELFKIDEVVKNLN